MGRRLVGDDVEPLAAPDEAPARPRRRCRRARSRAARRRPPRPAPSPAPRPRTRSGGRRSRSRGGGSPAPRRPRSPGRRPRSSSPPAAGRRPSRPGRRSARPGRAASRRSAGGPARRTSRTCPGGCPGCRCRSTTRRSSGRTSSGRPARARGTSSQFAHLPTRFELAMSTRGAHSWVRKTPTGLPLWTSSVSSSARARSSRTIASKAAQLRAARPGAAVDDQGVRVLGHLRVEVVHEHPEGGLLAPAAAAQLRAARGADGPGAGQRARSMPGCRTSSKTLHDELSEALRRRAPRSRR